MHRIVTIFCILLFGLYTIYWYWAAAGLKAAANDEFARWQSFGYFTRASDLRVEGFPWRLGLEITDFSVKLVSDSRETVVFDAEYVSASGNLIGPIEYLEHDSFDQGFDLSTLQNIKIFIGNVTLPENRVDPLPAVIEGIDISLNAQGLLALTGSRADRLEKWRKTDGKIVFNSIDLIWNDIVIDAKGQLMLDEFSQLTGAFSTTTAGMPKLLNALGAQKVIDPDVASIAAAGAKFFAVPLKKKNVEGAEHNQDVISLPVNFRDGGMWLGPIQLLHIGPIVRS